MNLYQYSNQNYYCGIDISNLKFIGQGHQGKVYFLPPNKVIKVFNKANSCKSQLYLLQCGSKSRFFPKVYQHDDYSIIMDFINGRTLKEYLKTYDLNENLAFQLVEIFNDFESLGFTRIDIRLGHIFVQADESIKIIDPRKNFEIIQKYPISMLKGLKKLGVLDKFFNIIQYKYANQYINWRKNFYSKEQYL
ncbi:serine/threonine protein kinase [Clostridium aciditolerans]|uniref:Serine/threonine protein kinase n=1 Tax=Clostridium aciditolerans TaxID=339861 RepID=A0A934HUA8_9CLOT|nr:serine/threonine protein kinase [Clostridium aciditolerans]MBI6874686.1 serine/threonine protein kinase [Clostridium aciditolerans]